MLTQSPFRRAGALFVALAAMMACNRQPTAEPPPSTASVPPAEANQPAAANDAWITTNVQARYFADEAVRGSAIDVDTKQGVVTLRGNVGSEAEKNQAVTLARQVTGVTRVDEQLQVSASPSFTEARRDGTPSVTPTADRTALGAGWITTKIQAQYFADPDVKPWNIDVDTSSSGVVTLRGEVESEQARREALRIAKSTEGVREVVDRLRVRGASEAAASPAGSATGATSSETAQTAQQQKQTQPTDEKLRDPWITAMIQSKYFIDDEVKGAEIDVTTENGIVTLEGQVDSASERRQAVALARSTTGVQDVRDQLTVKPTGGAESPTAGGSAAPAREDGRDLSDRTGDAWITTKIQSKYFMDPQIRAMGIDVTTLNGVVTLKGTVDSGQARRNAETIARETDGVTRVVNNLTVKAETSS
jgi:osmotically-inducible protein OsmY